MYLQNSERFIQLGEEKVPHLWPVYEPKRELLKSPRFQVSKLLVGNDIKPQWPNPATTRRFAALVGLSKSLLLSFTTGVANPYKGAAWVG